MIYLILAILSSTMVALVLKFSESRSYSRDIVTTINYVTASLFSLFMVLRDSIEINISSLFKLSTLLPILEGSRLSIEGSIQWSLFVGIFSGLLYYMGFILIQVNIKKSGVGLTGAFSKLGIFIPILFSILVWNEIPSTIKVIGMILSILSIFIINKAEDGKPFFKGFNLWLIALLLVVGSGDFSNKIFEKYAIVDYKNLYLSTLFITALIISSIITIKNYLNSRVSIKVGEIATGVMVGVPNLLTSIFLIESFPYFNTGVIYSSFSCGTIMLITIGGVAIFKERIAKREWIAILTIFVALFLLNI